MPHYKIFARIKKGILQKIAKITGLPIVK